MLTALNILVKLSIAASHLAFALLLPLCIPFDPVYSHSPFYILYYVVMAASAISSMIYVAFAFETFFDPSCMASGYDKVTVMAWLSAMCVLYVCLLIHMMGRQDHTKNIFVLSFMTGFGIMVWSANMLMLLFVKEYQ